MDLVVETMASECPEDLERLAAQTPSGAAKVKMESALFRNLLETDPEAALEAARKTAAPMVAAEHYAAIGLSVVKDDPERAFDLAKNLFAACPDAAGMQSRVEFPAGGSSGSSVEIPGVADLLGRLLVQDPQRTLEMTTNLEANRWRNSAFYMLANQWAERDFPAYTTWVNRQTDSEVRNQGAEIVINILSQQRQYAEAADWLLSLKQGGEGIESWLANWQRNDPQAVMDWLESADIPETRKAEVRANLDQAK